MVWQWPATPLCLDVIACRCTLPTIAGESGSGSPLIQMWTLAGVRLSLSWASLDTAPCGVEAAGSPPQVWTLAGVRLTAVLGESTGALAKVLGESLVQISLGQ